jgi:hypothetical protein
VCGVDAAMTKRKLSFIWVDDAEEKVDKYRRAIEEADFEGFGSATLEPLIVERNVLESITGLKERARRADLIIMDHVFSRARSGSQLKLDGASAAHLVRKIWPDVPIVCVTAMLPNQPRKLDQEDLSEYVAVYAYGELDEQLESLFAIARDFKKLLPKRGDARRQLVDLLKPPKTERDSVLRAMPSEFRSQRHATTLHRVASWILGVFMQRPGFLYDRLRAATLVGLNETGFTKVEDQFAQARYAGPFATQSRPLWWVRELTELVFSKSGDSAATSSQIAGRSLVGITAADHSKCYVDKPAGEIPDVVARLAPTKELRAVASRHTRPDPEDPASLPGFEALLVIES